MNQNILKNQVTKIFEIFKKENVEPKIELKYNNSFTLLIAVLLSAQSTDIRVNKITKTLLKKYNTPKKILSLGEEKLKEQIKSIGLFNNKAKNIILLCKKLLSDYKGIVPNNLNDLISLPGIGRKSANVILNTIFKMPTMPVDTHVFRVSRRIGFSNKDNILQLERELLKKIPTKFLYYAHHWLVLHGRYTCKARKPICDKCKISKYCNYYKKITQ